MKAMVLKEYNKDLVLEDRETPKPGSNEIVIKVASCGICGTDIKIVTGLLPHIITLPRIPGHEIAGNVVEVGGDVKNVKVGDQGIAYFYRGCGDCEMCRTSRENICYSIKRLGFELDGGFRQYIKLPAYNFCPFNGDLPLGEMAILPDAVATPYHALKRLGNVKIGQTVLIVGVGGLGVHALQIAKLIGAKIAAADLRDEAINKAESFGAELLVDPKWENPYEAIMEWTEGKGVDVVLEGVGKKETFEWSLPSLKRGGRLIIMGYDPINPLPVSPLQMHYNEWIIMGARLSTKQELIEVIRLVEQGDLKPVVAKTIPLEEINAGLEEVKRGENIGRIVLSIE